MRARPCNLPTGTAVRRASADRLPFGDAQFSRASMTGVLGFLPDPLAALRAIHHEIAA